jgi:hypothetical protein
MLIHDILTPTELNDIINNPVVQTHKAQLSNTNVVKFSVSLSSDIRVKLSDRLGIELSSFPRAVPMRWVKGDTLPHMDRGVSQFTKTHLVYLTSSSGSLVIDGVTHPINAGDAHIFSEGLQHFTINTGTTERLLLGPMSENGFGVGLIEGPYITGATGQQHPFLYCGSMFTNNAQVHYKSHSLSTGSGGSGVRNSRYKKRRT